jgi:photosystem II stability/assembly factor-like uncharacterized protein
MMYVKKGFCMTIQKHLGRITSWELMTIRVILLIMCAFLLSSCKDNCIESITPVDTTRTYLGLGDERIQAIAIDPQNSNTIYAGSSYNFSAGTPGRLFKTIDSGNTWKALITDNSSMFLAIVIDPNNSRTIYAAPWGIIKSNDGGLTWHEQDNGVQTFSGETHVSTVLMDPFDSKILYAGTGGTSGGYFYKSIDGGNTWMRKGDSLVDGIISVAINPNNSNIIYAGTAGRGILWKSKDAGEHWIRTGLGTPQGLMYGLCIDNNNSQIIYAGTTWSPPGFLPPSPFHGIFKSVDGGANWQDFNAGLPDSSGITNIIKDKSSGNIFVTLSNAFGTSGIYEFQAATASWSRIGLDFSNPSDSYVYCDLKISSDGQTLYYGGAGFFKLKLR